MLARYTLTPEDFAEALRLRARVNRPPSRRVGCALWAAGLFALFVAAVVVAPRGTGAGGQPAPPVEVYWRSFLLYLLMYAGLAAIVWYLIRRLPAAQRRVYGWVPFALVVIGALIAGVSAYHDVVTPDPPPPPAGQAWQGLLPFITPALVVVFAMAVLSRASRLAGWVLYEVCPHLHGELHVEATVHGVVVRGPLAGFSLTWPVVRSVAASDKVVVLFVSEAVFHVVPTRGFPTPADAAAFNNLAMAMVPPPGAGPAVAPPPLPREPAQAG